MSRLSRNTDKPYTLRRDDRQYDEYDSYVISEANNRSAVDRNSQSSYHTYENPQSSSNRQSSTDDDQQEHNYSPLQNSRRVNIESSNPEVVVRRVTTTNSNQTTTTTPKVDCTVQQAPSTNPRAIVLDINITITVGNSSNRNLPQVITSTNNIPIQTASPRSTAILNDIGYVDLDLRAPDRTGRLSTDGTIRMSTAYSNNNNNK